MRVRGGPELYWRGSVGDPGSVQEPDCRQEEAAVAWGLGPDGPQPPARGEGPKQWVEGSLVDDEGLQVRRTALQSHSHVPALEADSSTPCPARELCVTVRSKQLEGGIQHRFTEPGLREAQHGGRREVSVPPHSNWMVWVKMCTLPQRAKTYAHGPSPKNGSNLHFLLNTLFLCPALEKTTTELLCNGLRWLSRQKS